MSVENPAENPTEQDNEEFETGDWALYKGRTGENEEVKVTKIIPPDNLLPEGLVEIEFPDGHREGVLPKMLEKIESSPIDNQ